MNILPKKSWHVYSIENREKVLKDERKHAIEEEKLAVRIKQYEDDKKLDMLKEKAKSKFYSNVEPSEVSHVSTLEEDVSVPRVPLKHVDLFTPDAPDKSLKQTKTEKLLAERKNLEQPFVRQLPKSNDELLSPWYSKMSGSINHKDQQKEEAIEIKRWKIEDPIHKFKNEKTKAIVDDRHSQTKSQKVRADHKKPSATNLPDKNSTQELRRQRLEREAKERTRAKKLQSKG